jgi:hypothetical protein
MRLHVDESETEVERYLRGLLVNGWQRGGLTRVVVVGIG